MGTRALARLDARAIGPHGYRHTQYESCHSESVPAAALRHWRGSKHIRVLSHLHCSLSLSLSAAKRKCEPTRDAGKRLQSALQVHLHFKHLEHARGHATKAAARAGVRLAQRLLVAQPLVQRLRLHQLGVGHTE